MIRLIYISLVVFVLIVPAATQAAIFTLPTNSPEVQVGSVIDLPVVLNPDGDSIDTARAVLSYDPTVLQATGFHLVSPLNMAAPASFIDKHAGIVSWGGFHITERITTPATFGLARFKSIAAGNTTIKLLPSSHIISGGHEVGVVSLATTSLRILPTSTGAQMADNSNQTSVNSSPKPEYDYKILRGTAFCNFAPAVCSQPWWVAAISISLLLLVWLGLHLWHHHIYPTHETPL